MDAGKKWAQARNELLVEMLVSVCYAAEASLSIIDWKPNEPLHCWREVGRGESMAIARGNIHCKATEASKR